MKNSKLIQFVATCIVAYSGNVYAFIDKTMENSKHDKPIKHELQELTDNYLKKYAEKEHISGVSLSVSTKNIKPVYSVYSGYTEFSGITPIDSSNLYQIGSITKSFISTILLQLEADPENHFSINDPLKKYFPEYKKWSDVTVKQLLNMTSGISNYTEDKQFSQDLAKNPTREWLPEELVAYAYNKPMSHTNQFYYSNTNYILAGMIISKLTKHSVEEEMQLRFLDKNNLSHLDLHNTYYISHLYPASIIKRLVHGYFHKQDSFLPPETETTYFSLSWAGAAGANVSNTKDIIYWVKNLFNSVDVLAPQQRKELMSLVSINTGQPIQAPTADDPDAFGLGIGVSFDSDHPNDLIYNYEGGTLGYRAFYIYIPTKNITIAAIVNSAVEEHNDHLIELLIDTYKLVGGSAVNINMLKTARFS